MRQLIGFAILVLGSLGSAQAQDALDSTASTGEFGRRSATTGFQADADLEWEFFRDRAPAGTTRSGTAPQAGIDPETNDTSITAPMRRTFRTRKQNGEDLDNPFAEPQGGWTDATEVEHALLPQARFALIAPGSGYDQEACRIKTIGGVPGTSGFPIPVGRRRGSLPHTSTSLIDIHVAEVRARPPRRVDLTPRPEDERRRRPEGGEGDDRRDDPRRPRTLPPPPPPPPPPAPPPPRRDPEPSPTPSPAPAPAPGEPSVPPPERAPDRSLRPSEPPTSEEGGRPPGEGSSPPGTRRGPRGVAPKRSGKEPDRMDGKRPEPQPAPEPPAPRIPHRSLPEEMPQEPRAKSKRFGRLLMTEDRHQEGAFPEAVYAGRFSDGF